MQASIMVKTGAKTVVTSRLPGRWQASTTNKVTLRLRPHYTGPDNFLSGHSAGSLIFSLSSSYSDWLHGGCM
jgi:hypothetical protein